MPIGPRLGLPAPGEIHRTLLKITESLAREIAAPTPREPQWTAFEWVTARAVAAMHGISPLLWRDGRWAGPAAWCQFLADQREHTLQRHERILQLQIRIDAQARATGVAMTGLKGSALHALGVYASGERPMADIDLLVRPADIPAASAVLNSLGLQQTGESWKERLFSPITTRIASDVGEHSNNDLKVELHQRICERLPRSFADISTLIFPRHPVAGLGGYDSNSKLMIHLLLHAAGSMAFQSLRMLQLQDIALLSLRFQESDWDELLRIDAKEQPLWFAFPPLALALRYCRMTVPPRVLRQLARRCPQLLRGVTGRKTLYEVSYSYLWVRAFPGFEWSRSMPELLRYLVSRVRPDAAHMAERVRANESHAWAAQGRWNSLSQTHRVAAWLVKRPARSLTMHALNSALAQSS